ncbi:MAG: glycosyltransferase family 39 protein [Acidobacteriota bacterium]
MLAGTSIVRARHPFELEWMEGGMLDHVRWILTGHALYGPPSLDFTPFIYPPLFVYVAAGVAALAGISFLAIRIVSLIATMACLGLLFELTRRETGSRLAGLTAAGTFAACYGLTGFWLDIGRVDALMLAFLLASASLIDRSPAAAALLGALAFFTKQTALLPSIVLAIPVARRRASLARYALVYAALSLGGTVLLDALHGGWYRFYVFHLPAGHRRSYAALWAFVPELLVRFTPTAAAGAADVRRRDPTARPGVLLPLALGFVATSWLSLVKAGRFANLYIPACAGLAMLLGAFVARAARAPGTREAGVLALAVLQLAVLAYDPRRAVPAERDRQAGDAMVRAIGAMHGDVFVPFHGALGPMAGKPAHAHLASLIDVASGDRGGAVQTALDREVVEALRSHRWDAIVLDDPWLLWEIEKYYRKQGDVESVVKELDDPAVFRPITGRPVRPRTIYTPREAGR